MTFRPANREETIYIDLRFFSLEAYDFQDYQETKEIKSKRLPIVILQTLPKKRHVCFYWKKILSLFFSLQVSSKYSSK